MIQAKPDFGAHDCLMHRWVTRFRFMGEAHESVGELLVLLTQADVKLGVCVVPVELLDHCATKVGKKTRTRNQLAWVLLVPQGNCACEAVDEVALSVGAFGESKTDGRAYVKAEANRLHPHQVFGVGEWDTISRTLGENFLRLCKRFAMEMLDGVAAVEAVGGNLIASGQLLCAVSGHQ